MTNSPNSTPRPNSPLTRPWFAAFFKRRPSLDPYKLESSNSQVSSPAKVSLLNRLRAKTSSSSPQRSALSPISPHRFFFQSDFDGSFREMELKDSPREQQQTQQQQQPQPQQQQQQQQSSQQQQYQQQPPQQQTNNSFSSPKLASRMETLFQAAQISSLQYSFRKPLPSLREETEPVK